MAISKAFVQKTFKKHFPKFGDAIVNSTYVHFTNQSSDYDPETGDVSDDSTQFSIGVIYADFSFTRTQSGFKEIENVNVLARDKKAIIQKIDFPADLKPEIDDILIDPNISTQFFVVGMNIDPYEAVYLLHLRPKEDL